MTSIFERHLAHDAHPALALDSADGGGHNMNDTQVRITAAVRTNVEDFERHVPSDAQPSGALDDAGGGDQNPNGPQVGIVTAVRSDFTDFERHEEGDTHHGTALDHADGGGQEPHDAHGAFAAAVRTDLKDFERQSWPDAHVVRALDDVNGGGQRTLDAHITDAVAVHADLAGLGRQRMGDAHHGNALDDDGLGDCHRIRDAQRRAAVADPSTIALRLAADTLLDVERLRIATANRIRALSEIPQWEATPAALRWEAHLAALQDLERQVTRELEHAMKAHPLGPFVVRTVGLGLKQTGRLIGALGDPSWNSLEDRPRRGPAELWAFCGYAPGQRRRKGVRSNWNAQAKMRAYLVAESCIKQRTSPYRPVYDAARANWSGREVTDGHAHAHALRLVAKAVLRDLWVEAMRLREGA